MRRIESSNGVKQAGLLMAALGFGVIAALSSGCTNTATSNSAPITAASATASASGNHAGHERQESMDHTMGTTGLEALKQAEGREFDIAFLSQMIAHHEAAVEMAEMALKNASDASTKAEAQKVVTAQTGEIKKMTGWLKQWYGVEPSSEQQALVRKDMESMMAMPVTSDQMFYAMMIPHHQGAIDMSELAPERSQRPEVKQLAAQIIRAQKAEIAVYHSALSHNIENVGQYH